jgi:KaiC/GvpD/RAD55 family RecA-like ATPase
MLLKNNELVLLLTYYETADRVRKTLKEIGIEVDRHEKEKNLMIIEDITKIYFGSGHDFYFSLIYLINKKRNGVKMVYL